VLKEQIIVTSLALIIRPGGTHIDLIGNALNRTSRSTTILLVVNPCALFFLSVNQYLVDDAHIDIHLKLFVSHLARSLLIAENTYVDDK